MPGQIDTAASDRQWAEHLRLLYGDAAFPEVARRIDTLLSAWDQSIDAGGSADLGPGDVALITYGDTLNDGESPPLRTLHDFYRTQLADVFDIVHILPFQPFSSDAGFSVIDYYAVREDLGDWDDVAALANDCRVMVDAVINHISCQSEWFQGFLAGRPEYHDFFIDCDPQSDLSAVVRPRTSPLLTPYVDREGTERHMWTTFSADQIDLNYRSPDLLLAVLDVLLFLVSKGARLLRLDAVTFLWKEPGTSCANLPETHAIIKLIRAVLSRACPEVIVITETNVPHHENIAYFGDGYDEARMVYNFALPPLVAHSLITGDAQALSDWAASLRLPGDDVCFFNFTASHDGVGVRPVEEILSVDDVAALTAAANAAGGLVSFRTVGDSGERRPYEINCTYLDLISKPDDSTDTIVSRFVASQSIVLAMPGVPAIYIQSLLGTRNDIDRVALTGRARSINRSRLDRRTVDAELEDKSSLRSRIFTGLVDMIRVRRRQRAFAPTASFEVLNRGNSLFILQRECAEQALLCVVNVSNEPVDFVVPDGVDVLSGRKFAAGPITLEAYEVLWVELTRAS